MAFSRFSMQSSAEKALSTSSRYKRVNVESLRLQKSMRRQSSTRRSTHRGTSYCAHAIAARGTRLTAGLHDERLTAFWARVGTESRAQDLAVFAAVAKNSNAFASALKRQLICGRNGFRRSFIAQIDRFAHGSIRMALKSSLHANVPF